MIDLLIYGAAFIALTVAAVVTYRGAKRREALDSQCDADRERAA